MAGIALKSAENKGFPRALVLKNGGLGRFPNRRFVVEVTGFEPATFWSRTKRATKLRYTSMWSQ